MHRSFTLSLSAVSVLVALVGCGGGGGDSSTTPQTPSAAPAPEAQSAVDATTTAAEVTATAATAADTTTWSEPDSTALRLVRAPAPPPASPPPSGPVLNASATTADRLAAASATANSTTNECAPIHPFYWEIGDKNTVLASGSATSTATTTKYVGTTAMNVASASKWVYGTYVAQKLNGQLSADDRKYLQMSAGYNSFDGCAPGQTVGACQAYGTNGVYTASQDTKFDYGGGHMQKHAVMMGLGPLTPAKLTTEVKAKLGTEIALNYGSQLAGGVTTSPEQYAKILRKIMNNQLQMGSLLGTNPVCTNPVTCGTALFAPLPPTESWHYSVGHWVEDDPKVGDGTFSSPGAFGFYPWIDATKQFYGIVARQQTNGALGSVYCGRKIRKAWLSAVAQ